MTTPTLAERLRVHAEIIGKRYSSMVTDDLREAATRLETLEREDAELAEKFCPECGVFHWDHSSRGIICLGCDYIKPKVP